MDKRYQFFISSTFTDLKEERQAVLKAVLELNQMPAGMELFPALDDSAWQLIRDVIDGSDYYVLIVGGRYGSMDDEGLGYTEKEYDYAVQTKKPVTALLHKNPEGLARDRTETDNATWKKLQAFRGKVEKRHTCVYWRSAEELQARALVSLSAAMKRHPTVGWVRADQVPSGATLAEVLNLRNRISELESEAQASAVAPPAGTQDLQHGEDELTITSRLSARGKDEDYTQKKLYTLTFPVTWNQVFGAVAPVMINEASEHTIRRSIQTFLIRKATETAGTKPRLAGKVLGDFSFGPDPYETYIIQFRALGLIRENEKPRSVKDVNTYWRLTPYGDHLMTQIRALRRDRPQQEQNIASEPD